MKRGINYIDTKIASYIDECFDGVSSDINKSIRSTFLKDEKISELQRPFLKVEVIKHIVDNHPSLNLNASGLKEISNIGLSLADFKGYKKDNIHFGAFRQASKESVPVEYLSSKMNAIFLHGFVDNQVLRPVSHSPLHKKVLVSLKSQCDLIRATQGEISTSTASINGKRNISLDFQNAFMGLIISAGVVTSASKQDSYTVLDDDGVRRGTVDSSLPDEIITAIKSRNSNILESDYNEIIVRQPEIAGVYYKMDAFRMRREGEENSFTAFHHPASLFNNYRDMQKAAISVEDKPLTLICMYNGKLNEMSVDLDKLKEYCMIDKDTGRALMMPKTETPEEVDSMRSKAQAWQNLGEQNIMTSIVKLGKELAPEDLFKMGQESLLKPNQKMELLQENKDRFKSKTIIELYEKKINEEIYESSFKNRISQFSNKLRSSNEAEVEQERSRTVSYK